jgi:hypothetical protein
MAGSFHFLPPEMTSEPSKRVIDKSIRPSDEHDLVSKMTVQRTASLRGLTRLRNMSS